MERGKPSGEREKKNIKANALKVAAVTGQHFSSLNVAPWRSSAAAFPHLEGFQRAFFAPGSKFDSFLTVPTLLKRRCDGFSSSSISLPWTPPSVNQLNRFNGILP